jgi:hypothetical protein
MGKYGVGIPGSHQTGPIVSKYGIRIGDKDSSLEIVNSAGKLIQGSGVAVVSQTLNLVTIGAAGTYVGDILLPAGHLIHNISVVAAALCNAGTSAVLDIGDYTNAATPVVIDADGFFAAINLKATDLLATEGIDFYRTGGKQGVYLPYTTNGQNAASHVNKLYSASARRIRASAVTAGTTATTGSTLITVVYSVPELITDVAFTAAE